MSPLLPPSYSAMVSPELVALLRDFAAPLNDVEPVATPLSTDALDTDPQASPANGTPFDPTEPPPSRQAWRSVRLRRDGMPPLCLEVLPLAETEDDAEVVCGGEPYIVKQRVALFVTPSDTVALQVAFLPPDGSPARPVFHAWHVTSAEECSALLEGVGAAQCFIVSTWATKATTESPRLPFTPATHSTLLN